LTITYPKGVETNDRQPIMTDRHELQKNELASYLHKINTSIEPYSKLIAVGVGALIIGGIALGLYRSKVSGDRSDATLQLIQAVGSSNAEQLQLVGDSYPSTPSAAWSRLYEGNAHLADGIRSLYSDREDAEARLGDARSAFNAAMVGSSDPLLLSRAHFGNARVAESLGKIDEAIEAYKKCIQANESEAMVNKAKDRIAALSQPQTKDFLVWFGKQDFAPAEPSLPPALPSGKTLPDLPDLDLPPLGAAAAGDSAAGDSAAGDDKAGEQPAAEPRELKDGGLELPSESDVKQEAADKSEDADPANSPADETLSDPAATEDAATKDAATTEDAPTKDAEPTKATESTAEATDSDAAKQ
jgi:tetratricopeptide (TPR) repeat protein